ncbi:unnamed protein product [Pieris macdunnoughi]|uniref:Uncharacterized protein n=1 Tax=Pieris macdunnoughi TaxID=345717 RepID=A0A821LD74_9NEOP|nr:unnamed protein product [Pieris macdunnoughi]
MDDFNKIRTICFLRNTLWCDPDFLAEMLSLFYDEVPNVQFEWKRPVVSIKNGTHGTLSYGRYDPAGSSVP